MKYNKNTKIINNNNTKNNKKNHNGRKRSRKHNMTGGNITFVPKYDAGGTSGNITTLGKDVLGVLIYGMASVWDAIGTATEIIALPVDLGIAYDKGAPNPNNVKTS